MPEYPIPPWLSQQTDWGGLAMRSSALKAQIAQSAQRMAQEQQQFQAQMEMKAMALAAEQKAQQQQMTMNAEIAKHKIAVEQAYNQTTTQMKAAALAQAGRKVDLDYQTAAQNFAARQNFDNFVQERSKTVGYKTAFSEALSKFGMGADAPAAAYSAMGAMGDEEIKPSVSTVDGVRVIRLGKNRYERLTPPTAAKLPVVDKEELQSISKTLADLSVEARTGKKRTGEILTQEQLADNIAERQRLLKRARQLEPLASENAIRPPAETDTFLRWDANKGALVK